MPMLYLSWFIECMPDVFKLFDVSPIYFVGYVFKLLLKCYIFMILIYTTLTTDVQNISNIHPIDRKLRLKKKM